MSLVLMGRIGAPWGVKGHSRIQSYTNPVGNIFSYPKWHIQHNDQWFLFELKNHQHHANALIAQLKGVETRTEAQKLTHAGIYVSKDDLPKCAENEYYWSDLEGLEVINTASQSLGKVSFLYEAGAQDNMVVVNNTTEVHIPFVLESFILEVDLAQKKILVDWAVE